MAYHFGVLSTEYPMGGGAVLLHLMREGPMKPFRITLSGETLNTDRAELEKELRSKAGLPPEQPIEFIEDTIRPMSPAEKQVLLALSEDFKEDDEDEEDDDDE